MASLRVVEKGAQQQAYGQTFRDSADTKALYERYAASFGPELVCLEPADPKQYGLRPYQYFAFLKALDYYRKEKGHDGKVVMPTGSGKGIVIALCAYSIGKRVLIITSAPNLSREVEKHLREVDEDGVSQNRFLKYTGLTPEQFVALANPGATVPEIVVIRKMHAYYGALHPLFALVLKYLFETALFLPRLYLALIVGYS